jgi:hypothetical protein
LFNSGFCALFNNNDGGAPRGAVVVYMVEGFGFGCEIRSPRRSILCGCSLISGSGDIGRKPELSR